VHETGQFGLIRFAKPTPGQRAAIQRRIVRKAWWKYKEVELSVTDHWKDPERGDPEFYGSLLEPAIRRHNEYGDRMKDLGKLDRNALALLFREAPALMEFRFEVEALRQDYLAAKLVR